MSVTLYTIVCLLSSVAAAPSALDQARDLTAPTVQLVEGGEFEGEAFWSTNQQLLKTAWQQYGRRHETLYTFDSHFEQLYITPEMRAAVAAARNEHQEHSLRQLFHPAAPNVTGTKHLFTSMFREHLVDELNWLQQSGIPQRRPNGMNRFGSILSEAPGSLRFADMIQKLTAAYLTPMALSLFPTAALWSDVNESYAFVIRYKKGEDVSLKEHADASVITLNLCLLKDAATTADEYDLQFETLEPYGSRQPAFRGSSRGTEPHSRDKSLKGSRVEKSAPSVVEITTEDGVNSPPGQPSKIKFNPGDGLFHMGQHRHSALQLLEGERINLIIWLHGKWGVVRIMPYDSHEILNVHQRWPPTQNRRAGRSGEAVTMSTLDHLRQRAEEIAKRRVAVDEL